MSRRVVLFTGSRDYPDTAASAARVENVLEQLPPDALIVHGAQRGLDMLVDRIARLRGFEVRSFPAAWKLHGRAAGTLRNQQMLDDAKPTEGHAFPLASSVGTWDMVRRLRGASVPVEVHRS